MVATRHVASDVPGLAVATSANAFQAPCTTSLELLTTEASQTITFRSAGVISNLSIRVASGDRTTGTPHVCVYKNGAQGNEIILLAPGGTPVAAGEYEDATNTDTIAAGDTVTLHVHGGGGGTANWTFNTLGFIFAATDGTVTRFAANALVNYAVASETSYRNPSSGGDKTATQALAEWLVKLPAGVSGVTIRKLYVRVSGNTRTTSTTVAVNGATGAGTAPGVTIAGSSGATTQEDQSNSIVAQDGDQISFKVVTGTGTGTLTITEIAVEVYSTNGVSFFIASRPAGEVLASTNLRVPLGWLNSDATESRAQSKIGLARTLSHLSVYWTDGTTGTFNLRANGATVGAPGNISTGSADNAWSTDSTNTYVTAPADVINYNFVMTAACTAHCIAVTVTAAPGRSQAVVIV